MKPTYNTDHIFTEWFTFKNYYRIIAKRLAELNRHVEIAEIGVLEGASTSFLAVELESLDVPYSIFAIDTFAIGRFEDKVFDNQREKFEDQMSRCLVADKVHALEGDSSIIANDIADDSLDFVFVDGNHSFLGITKDVGCYWNKLKDGGYMGAHDYTPAHPAVFAFGNELRKSNVELEMEFYGEPDNVWSVRKSQITTP